MTPTHQPMGSPEFFAVEAGEYLDRMQVLAARADVSAADEFSQLCRALRGSALMANQRAIGMATAALEHVALAVKAGRLPWDHRIRGLAGRTVTDIGRLVNKLSRWSAAEDAMAEAIVAELDTVSGESSVEEPVSEQGLDAGFVAFAAGQGASLASALTAVSAALEVGDPVDEPLEQVRNLLRPMTGLAALSEVPPIPDLLSGLDGALGLASGTHPPPAAVPLLTAAAAALTAAAAQLRDTGTADADSPEARAFAEELAGYLDAEGDVVPIETLLYDDEPATPAPTLAALELVSLGERLTLAADELAEPRSETQRDLRAQALEHWLSGLTGVSRGPLQIALADFADAARGAIASGMAVDRTELLVGELRAVGRILSQSSSADDEALALRLFEAARTLREPPEQEPEPAAEPAPEPAAAAETLPTITALCYSGRPAVDRALALRAEVLSALEDPAAPRTQLTALIEEVFDLVELGLAREP